MFVCLWKVIEKLPLFKTGWEIIQKLALLSLKYSWQLQCQVAAVARIKTSHFSFLRVFFAKILIYILKIGGVKMDLQWSRWIICFCLLGKSSRIKNVKNTMWVVTCIKFIWVYQLTPVRLIFNFAPPGSALFGNYLVT